MKQRGKYFLKQVYFMVVTIDEAEECPHVPMLELFLPPIISWELQERKQERNQISL